MRSYDFHFGVYLRYHHVQIPHFYTHTVPQNVLLPGTILEGLIQTREGSIRMLGRIK